MNEVSIIGLDLAKNVFQAHGAAADGTVVFRRKLGRAQLLRFFAGQQRCLVAMEACASAHHWARAIEAVGHEVRLIAPGYVKPFVKRQKNDAADAEAIAEAASRPTMRFVAVKTEAQQAAAMAFQTRDLFVRQRTQTINALRGHLAEHGVVAPAGPAYVGRLGALIEGEEGTPTTMIPSHSSGPPIPTAFSPASAARTKRWRQSIRCTKLPYTPAPRRPSNNPSSATLADATPGIWISTARPRIWNELRAASMPYRLNRSFRRPCAIAARDENRPPELCLHHRQEVVDAQVDGMDLLRLHVTQQPVHLG